MLFEEVKKYFSTSYRFQKRTGMMSNNFNNWEKKGFIPIKTQIKLEQLTNGELKANLEHLKKDI